MALSGTSGGNSNSVAVTTMPGTTIYSNDFEKAAGSEWSNTKTSPVMNGSTHFLGDFSNDTVTLNLGSLPSHVGLTVSFDLYILRSWDGVDKVKWGPDEWKFSEDSNTLLDTSFSNHKPSIPGTSNGFQDFPNSFGSSSPHGAMYGATATGSLGYHWYRYDLGVVPMDSTYHLTYSFAHTASTVTLSFQGLGLQGLNDESWGLDNIKVVAQSGTAQNLTATATPALPQSPQTGVINLRWYNDTETATGFSVWRSTDGTTFSPIATINDPSASIYTDTALQPNTKYYYKIRALYPSTTIDSSVASTTSAASGASYGDTLDSVTIPVTRASSSQWWSNPVQSNIVLQSGVHYELVASGDFFLGGPFGRADAEYAFNGTTNAYEINSTHPDHNNFGIGVNDVGYPTIEMNHNPYWGAYNTAHVYMIDVVGAGQKLTFNFHDNYYDDNVADDSQNPLHVQIFQHVDLAGPKFDSTPPTSLQFDPHAAPVQMNTAPWKPGDIVVSEVKGLIANVMSGNLQASDSPGVQEYSPEGVPVGAQLTYSQTNPSRTNPPSEDEAVGLAFDSQGNLYTAEYGFSTLVKFDSQQVPSLVYGDNNVMKGDYGVITDGLGNLYVSSFGNGFDSTLYAGASGIWKFNPQGQPVEEFLNSPTAYPVRWMTMGPDDHTIYYTAASQDLQTAQTINVLDTNSGVSQPFTVLPNYYYTGPAYVFGSLDIQHPAAFGIRYLPNAVTVTGNQDLDAGAGNGGPYSGANYDTGVTTVVGGTAAILVADQGRIFALDANGNIVNTYDYNPLTPPTTLSTSLSYRSDWYNYYTHSVRSWFSIDLDPDGRSFWAASSENGAVVKFDIATGAVEKVFYVTDIGGNATLLNGVAVYGEPGAAQSVVNQPLIYDAHASDPTGHGVIYSLVGSANGAAIDPNTGVMTWTPTGTGNFVFTLKAADATNSASYDTQTFTLSVTSLASSAPKDTGPIFTTLQSDFNNSPAYVGRPYTNRIHATDADGDALTYSLVNSPGFTIDLKSGTLSFFPTQNDLSGGTRTVTVDVSDGRSAPVPCSFTVTILPSGTGSTSSPMSFNYQTVPDATVGQPWTFKASVSAATGDVY